MKNYMISYSQHQPGQNKDMISFAVARTGIKFAQVDTNIWYVRTWLSATQIKDRLAFWFEETDELRVYELGQDEASLNSMTYWTNGSLKPPVAAITKQHFDANRFQGYNRLMPATESSVENSQEA